MAVDPRATGEELGWEPAVGLAEGIAATVAWARERHAASA
jgi:UDP-glucose 4-epimerase